MKELLTKITQKLKVKEVAYEFFPIDKVKLTRQQVDFLQNLNLISFITHTNTFIIRVDQKAREALNRFFAKKFLFREDTSPGIYLWGEVGKSFTFSPLDRNEVAVIRNSYAPFVAIEVLRGNNFLNSYTKAFIRNLKEEIKKLPVKVAKELDLDEHPFRREIFIKGFKNLSKEEVQYVLAVKRAIEKTSTDFLKNLATFSKLVFENFPNLKKGKIPEELQKIELEMGKKIGDELLKHSAEALLELYNLMQVNIQNTQDFLASINNIEKQSNKTSFFNPSF